jgi:hypothetical protein
MPIRLTALVSLTSSASTFSLSVHRAGDLFVVPRPDQGRLELHDRSWAVEGPVAWRAGGAGWSHTEYPEFELPGIALRPRES